MPSNAGQPLPTDVASNVKSDVAKRIPQMEALRRGDNIPSGMDGYLAGYIDAHYEIEDDLESLVTLLEQFDQELAELRAPTCYKCETELGAEWREANQQADDEGTMPADCPRCGENPLPPVGGRDE